MESFHQSLLNKVDMTGDWPGYEGPRSQFYIPMIRTLHCTSLVLALHTMLHSRLPKTSLGVLRSGWATGAGCHHVGHTGTHWDTLGHRGGPTGIKGDRVMRFSIN